MLLRPLKEAHTCYPTPPHPIPTPPNSSIQEPIHMPSYQPPPHTRTTQSPPPPTPSAHCPSSSSSSYSR